MRVTIRPLGRTLSADPGQTVLDAALKAHVNLPHSCKRGSCGSCRARLLSGQVHYPNGPPLALAVGAGPDDVLLCQAVPDTDLTVEAREIRAVTDVTIRSLPCRVARLERLAPDVMKVLLKLPAVEEFPFQAGQYLDVMVAANRRRSFSIACPPHDAVLIELHVRRVDGGGFTRQVFETLKERALLTIEGPIGQFVYRGDGAGPALLIAGGTGFAPIKAILRHVLESGSRRALTLYWGARRAPDLYEDQWVRDVVRRFEQFHYVPVLSDPTPEEAAQFRTGPVHEAVLALHPDLSTAEVYAAGPPAMIEALKATLPTHGLKLERLYFDSFDFAPDAARAGNS